MKEDFKTEEITDFAEAEEAKEERESPAFTLEYKIAPDESAFAIDRFFSKFMIKTNVLYTAIFSVLSVIYLVMVIKNADKPLYYFLLAACIAVVIGLWIKPKGRKKQFMAAIEAVKDDIYICEGYFKKLKITTIIPKEEQTEDRIKNPLPRVIDFTRDFVQVEEYESVILMFVQKEITYIFPKNTLGEENTAKIKEFLKENCEYKEYDGK